MTDLMERAIGQLEKLPATEQDHMARWILDELEDEAAWESRFRLTTDEQWDRMAESVRREIAAGSTESLDGIFPTLGT